MRVKLRTGLQSLLSALALGILAAGMAGGCPDQPATGTGVVESPEVQNKREESVKDAMPLRVYEPRHKQKSAHRRAAAVDLGGAGAFGPRSQRKIEGR
jgi:hypothetical protein